jgi:hypothetical protein
MAVFDPNAIAEAYHRIADEAERYMNEAKSKISRSPSYRRVHDEHLAKFSLYYRLAARCESRETLLEELTRLAREPPSAPSNAFDAEAFTSAYRGWVKSAISQVRDTTP